MIGVAASGSTTQIGQADDTDLNGFFWEQMHVVGTTGPGAATPNVGGEHDHEARGVLSERVDRRLRGATPRGPRRKRHGLNRRPEDRKRHVRFRLSEGTVKPYEQPPPARPYARRATCGTYGPEGRGEAPPGGEAIGLELDALTVSRVSPLSLLLAALLCRAEPPGVPHRSP